MSGLFSAQTNSNKLPELLIKSEPSRSPSTDQPIGIAGRELYSSWFFLNGSRCFPLFFCLVFFYFKNSTRRRDKRTEELSASMAVALP